MNTAIAAMQEPMISQPFPFMSTLPELDLQYRFHYKTDMETLLTASKRRKRYKGNRGISTPQGKKGKK